MNLSVPCCGTTHTVIQHAPGVLSFPDHDSFNEDGIPSACKALHDLSTPYEIIKIEAVGARLEVMVHVEGHKVPMIYMLECRT